MTKFKSDALIKGLINLDVSEDSRGKIHTKLSRYLREFEKSNEAIVRVNFKPADSGNATKEIEKQTKEIDNSISKVKSALKSLENGKYNSSKLNKLFEFPNLKNGKAEVVIKRIDSLKNKFEELYKEGANLKLDGTDTEASINRFLKNYERITKFFDKIKAETDEIKAPIIYDQQWDKAKDKITTFYNSMAKLNVGMRNPGAMQELEGVMNNVFGRNYKSSSEAFAAISSIQAKFDQLGLSAETTGQRIVNSFKEKSHFFIIEGAIHAVTNALRLMYTNVINIDDALTELKKTTDLTSQGYKNFIDDAAQRAKDLGTSIADITNATADVTRLGYSITDSEEISDAILLYKNVADGVNDVSTASDTIISTLKAYEGEVGNVIEIVDKFNEVGNRTAISASDIGEILSRSAATLQFAGNSLDESIALAVGANSIVRNAEKAGTALKTLSLRLRGAKVDLEEAGLETEGMASSTSKLRDKILALTGNKVDIMLDADTFKSTYQILEEISKVWKSISDVDQAALLELMGGKNQANVLASIIDNFEDVSKAIAIAGNAEGSALRENELYLDSITGKLEVLNSVFEKISTNVLNSDLIKGGISGFTILAEIAEFLTGNIVGKGIAKATALAQAMSLLSKAGNYINTSKEFFSGNIFGFGFQGGSFFKGDRSDFIEKLKVYVDRYNDGLIGAALYADNLTEKQISLANSMEFFGKSIDENGRTKLELNTQKVKEATRSFTLFGVSLEGAIKAFSNTPKTGKPAYDFLKGIFNFSKAALEENPMLKFSIVAGGITLILEAIKAAYNEWFSVEGQLAKFEEQLTVYDEAKSKVEELTSQIETNQKRIDELNSVGGLSIVEDAELDKLKQENELLQAQLNIAKEKANIEGKEAAEKLDKATLLYFNKPKNNWQTSPTELPVFIAQAEINQYEDVLRRINEGEKDLIDNVDIYRDALVNRAAELSDLISQYQALGISVDDNEQYASLVYWFDQIQKSLHPDEWAANKWDEILGKEEFKDEIKILKDFNGMAEDLKNKFKDPYFADFINELIEVGLIADNTDESLLTLANSFQNGEIFSPLSAAFDDIEGKISEADSALERFKNKIEGGEKDDTYKDYAEIDSKVQEEINKGFTNSNTFWAGAEALLGADRLAELQYNEEEIISELQRIHNYYQDAEDSGIAFLDAALAHSEELKELGIVIEETSQGIDIDIPKDKYDEFAQVLGVTEEQVAAFVMAWSNLGEIDFYDFQELFSSLSAEGLITEDNVIFVDQLKNTLLEAGMSAKDVYQFIEQLKSSLSEEEYTEISISAILEKGNIENVSEEIQTAISEGLSIAEDGTYTINATPIIETMDAAGYAKEEIRLLLIQLHSLEDIEIENLSGVLTNLSLSDTQIPETTTETGELSAELVNAQTEANNLNNVSLSGLDAELTDSTNKTIELGNQALATASKFKTLNNMRSGTLSGITTSKSAYASGTNYAVPGQGLTGEDGAEIILDRKNNRSILVGTQGPEFYNFAGGETVFNADETSEILRNSSKRKNIFGSYAVGTISRVNINKYKNSVSRYTSSGSSSSSSSNSGKDAAKEAADALKDAADKMKDLLNVESDKAVEEIEKRIDAIEEEADALKDAADNAKDLAEAQNDLLKYEADIAKEALDDRIEQLKDEADLAQNNINIQINQLKDELELLKEVNEEEDKALKLQKAKDAYEAALQSKTARVYTADKGWVWTADPDKVSDAKKDLDELLKDYEREAAEKVITDQIEALEKQSNAIKEESEAQQNALKELSETWDEQLEKLDYTVEGYQKYLDYLNKYTNMSVGDMQSAITEFGSKIEEVMNLNSQAEESEKAYEKFKETADLEIEKLKELKEQWNDYAKNLSKTLEEYELELQYAAEFSTMSFEAMSKAVEDYMNNVKEAMKLNSEYQAAKDKYDSYATGTTSVPSTGMAIVDEQGNELIVRRPNMGRLAFLENGDGVIPANITQRLMALGANPSLYITQSLRGLGGFNRETTTSNIFNYHFGDVNLPNVSNANSFIRELDQLVNQRQNR